jgi:upstream activation factor subunit UAF30
VIRPSTDAVLIGKAAAHRRNRGRHSEELVLRFATHALLSQGDTRKGVEMAKKTKSARKPNAAFMKPVTPDQSLAEIVGAKPIPRTEVTKKLWAYIKKNGLQDKKNKRMIKADDALKTVFGGKSQVNMFEMTKLVSKHVK